VETGGLAGIRLNPAIPTNFTQEPALDKEKAQKVRVAIADVVGFPSDEVQDGDRFIVDYSIGYGERKALLDRLNAEFGKEMEFGAFCALEDVASVVRAYSS
jgi:hypothetical protein